MKERCDAIRDSLPLYAAGTLDREATLRIEQHLHGCAECRDEQALIALLRVPLAAPAGLDARVRRAVAAGTTLADASGWRFGHAVTPAWRTAIAAALAVVAIGSGGLLLSRNEAAGPIAANGLESVDLGWAARTDPVLHGGPGLESLSDEELLLLLEEMQS